MSNLDEVVGNFLSFLGYMRDNFFRPAEQIARLRLSTGQFHAMSIIARKGSLPMSELAGEMKISKQQLTPLISRLIDANLVFRKDDNYDRRVVLIELSADGKRTLEELRVEMKRAFAEKLGHLPDQELEDIDKMLKRIREIIESVK